MLTRNCIIRAGRVMAVSGVFGAMLVSARDSKERAECLKLAETGQFTLLLERYLEVVPKRFSDYFKDAEGNIEYLPTLASIMNDEGVLRALVKPGFDLRAAYAANLSPLEWAIKRKSNDACKALLEHIWQVESDPVQYVQRALKLSMESNNAQATYRIVECCSPDGWSPIVWAVSQRMHKALGVILSDTTMRQGNWGTNPDGKSALMLCVEEDLPHIADTLLDAGANPLHVDTPETPSPLESSVRRRNKALVLKYATAAARQALGSVQYPTALHWAVATDRLDIVDMLLEENLDLTLCDNAGNTPLHIACQQQNATMIARLVQAGAPTQSVNKRGLSSLDICARNTNHECLVALVSTSADAKHTHPFGWNPLIMASRRGNAKAVTSLLQAGAVVNSVDAEGNTALHWAARFGHLAIVQSLVEAGADVDCRNQYGLSALFWGCKNHHASVVRYLLDRGADTYQLERHAWFLRYAQVTRALKHVLYTFMPEKDTHVS